VQREKVQRNGERVPGEFQEREKGTHRPERVRKRNERKE